jgi:hypothetical protein
VLIQLLSSSTRVSGVCLIPSEHAGCGSVQALLGRLQGIPREVFPTEDTHWVVLEDVMLHHRGISLPCLSQRTAQLLVMNVRATGLLEGEPVTP